MNGRDELDARDWCPVEDVERLGEHDQGDRAPVPDLLAVRPCVPLEERPLVNIEIPIGDAHGEVAQRVRIDVDAAGAKTVTLHRRERSVVPDDVGDRIRGRHDASPLRSYEIAGRVWTSADIAVRKDGRMALQRMDNVGIVVESLDAA